MKPKKISSNIQFTENALEAYDYQDYLIKGIINKISDNKDKLILNKLKELNIDINFNEEKERRFKRFRVEIKDSETTYYYNDGSIDGLRIITFVDTQTPFDKDNLSISIETKYY